jgi:FkbM family methyltransferase
MSEKNSIKRWYIRICRYLFGQQYLAVMNGPLKGYLWTTASSYEYILGEYEDPEAMTIFLSWLQPATVFYDLGANVGYYSLAANRIITGGKIYSFEPLPSAQKVFKQHIELNRKHIANDNISLLPFAISNRSKEVMFSNNDIFKDGNTYVETSSVFSDTEKITVQCYSVDELVKLGYAKPDVLKIDVEGAEYDVLRGALDTLQQYKPNILLATHDYHLPGVKDRCVSLLQELGYILKHTGGHNKQIAGLDDYIAVHRSRI